MTETTRTSGLARELWNGSAHVYGAILAHPFLTGLTDGTLDRARFRHYVEQDAHYLRVYAGVLRAVGDLAPHDRATQMFRAHAQDALVVEGSLHAGFLRDLEGGDPGAGPDGGLPQPAAPVAPTTLAYTDQLLAAAATGSFAEALAAVLPCYWIYWEVGRALLERSSPDPLYARWIATYGGEEFGRVVADVLALTDEVATDLDDDERAAMHVRFATAARYEWMFWDAAHRLERWPV